MLQQLIAIFKNTFLESIRQPIYLIMIGIGVIALVINLNLAAYTMDDDNKFLIDMGMATIFLCGLLIAAFIATSVLTQEIENRTVLTVVSKPVGRPLFIVGKFLGVSGAVLIAVTILACTFMLTIRQGVLQAAKDPVDYPVVIFGVSAILLALAIGMAANFMYGWVFTSTTVGALFPLSFMSYVTVLAISKDWQFQLFAEHAVFGISPDLRPQILVAIYGLGLAILVMCAIAIAASTRFGQVMTLFACVMVFMIGLLTDPLIGKHVYKAQALARIMEVRSSRDTDDNFSDDGDWYAITLDKMIDLHRYQQETLGIEKTDPTPIFLAGDGRGQYMFGDFTVGRDQRTGEINRGIILTDFDAQKVTLRNIGGVPMEAIPFPGAYIHAGLPTTNTGWRIAWGVPPNLQSFILTDAVTQRHIVPFAYLFLLTIYAGLYITTALSVAVIFFQKREVG